MVYKQKVLGAIAAPGSEKNYKYIYIKHLMDTVRKIYDQLPGESIATRILSLRDEAIGYIDDDTTKQEFVIRADELANTIRDQLKKDNDDIYDNSQRIESKRMAAIRCVGWVLKYFDTAWNWSRKRGILIAGPFGDGRRRFLPLSLLPLDGKYIRVRDDYKPKEGEVVFEFVLRSLLLNNIEDPYDEARNDREEEQDQLAGEDENVIPSGSDGAKVST